MNKTESVSIGRKGFVCEQDAFEILKAYLKRAEKSLHSDPDKTEILQDLESALAGHLMQLTGDLVVDTQTAKKAVEIMGEVESSNTIDNGQEEESEDFSEDSLGYRISSLFKKPIYKDRNKAIIMGVCSGIAKTLETDPLWIRIIFITFALVTNGFGVLVYIILAVIMKDSEENKQKSASEVIVEVKDKLQSSISSARRPYENLLYRFFRSIWKVVVFSTRLVILLFMLMIGMAWSTLLFFMVANPSKIVLFGANPSWIDFTAILALGFVVLIPLFVLIATLVGSNIVKSVRFNLITWCLWLVALLIGAGSMINVVPDVRARLVREVPQTKNIYVEVEDNKLVYTCITLWGDCHENIPKISYKKICDTDVQVVAKDDWTQYNSLQIRGWNIDQKTFDYPASIGVYCDFIKSTVGTKGVENVVFDDREINDTKSDYYLYGIDGKIKDVWNTNFFVRRYVE